MRTPIPPLPDVAVRWMRRARRLRWLDALVGWCLLWTAVPLALPAAGIAARSVLAALIVLALAGVRRVRALWRPLSGPVGLIVSRSLRPGHRAWFVTARRAESVVVTSRRGPRVVIATMADGLAEGITVRRTRVFLVPVDRAARPDGPR